MMRFWSCVPVPDVYRGVATFYLGQVKTNIRCINAGDIRKEIPSCFFWASYYFIPLVWISDSEYVQFLTFGSNISVECEEYINIIRNWKSEV